MGIILNDDQFRSYIEKLGELPSEWTLRHQAETVCEPMLTHFDRRNRPHLMEWHHYLLDQGLRHPDGDWSGFTETLLENGALTALREHYAKFRGYWNGPDVPVYLLPIDLENKTLLRRLNRKNGITFPECVVLFIDENLPVSSMKALLTHEYNHVCRLALQNNDDSTVTLQESMIMEGLAEAAVRKALGPEELAPWTKLHSKEKSFEWWDNVLRHERLLKNRRRHNVFMYGNDGLPPMIGYAAGYHLVYDWIDQTPELSGRKRLGTPAEEILKESGWPF
ncbi:hypothetical protein CR205_03690 [Alteribacter lacisalsi]|uniref:DUF2268 domain-containing protein n=1 Tax=Alteribacter lacisalsi TaxID=2045244 RepID=A0A2W0HVJ4_9BACI|nr:DUF2268 domain-containing putative Zn-dependent protease [Alteribacter lacisalsi]PYZ97708.1 hypothetical protein CR205_03690 [Alteribacter lacisalsi]